jgi:hypothetical protein
MPRRSRCSVSGGLYSNTVLAASPDAPLS